MSVSGFTGPILDRQLIRERYGAYSDTTFQQDCEAWLACWAEACVWTVMGEPFVGKPALRARWDATWRWLERMMFFAEIGAIAVTGERAVARCYCREILHYRNGSRQKVVGFYQDQLVRQEGEWLFARRDYQLLSDEGVVRPVSPG